MKNVVFDRFTENWMNGGMAAREAFLRDLADLLQAERERCAALVEGPGLGRKCQLECHKAAASRIRELT